MKKLFSIVIGFFLFISSPLTVFAAEGGGVLPSGISYSNIKDVIDTYVDDHKDTTAAVSVTVFTGSDVLLEKAYGYSDIKSGVLNDRDTVFEWGSNTKLLTWTSVMQLVEKGKIRLDEDIRKYLPESFLTKLKFDTPVTMLNLMNHNAGWQETATDLWIENEPDVKELGDALKLVEPEQVNEPGKAVAYSNWGTALAAYIVECVSGQSFDDYVHEHIFKPLGMEHTAFSPTLSDNEWVAERRAAQKCYTSDNKSLGTYRYYLSLYPAGIATGTIGDFVKFGQAFLAAKGEKSPLFEKTETLGEMLSPSLYFADGKTARNCHGFWTDELGVPVLWHNGGTLGSSSWFAFDPKSGTGMIILTNQRGEAVYNCGLLPKVFGSYDGIEGTTPSRDISGMYLSSKAIFKGFAKPYSLFCHRQFVPDDKGGYTVPGPNFTVTPIGTESYLLDMGGLKQYVIYASTDSNGRRVLQMPGEDYVEVNGYGVIAQYALLGLFILAALYSFFVLVIGFIRFLKHKNAAHIMEKFHAIVNASIVITTMMVVYMVSKLFSSSPLLKDVQWSVILIAISSIVPAAYIILLTVKWRGLQCTRKEKRQFILTGIAGLIMVINIIFWESYKFW